MVNKYLGRQIDPFGKLRVNGESNRTIDIHGGGKDLIFPHHESEIAQSESYTGKSPFVKYWMHTAMVLASGEKMSKSLDNLIMIEDLLTKYPPNAIRWMILTHHYRRPWEFEEKELQLCEDYVQKVTIALKQINKVSAHKIKADSYLRDFICAMNDDLDTSKVLKLILRTAKRIQREKNKCNIKELQEVLKTIITTLGLKL
jgi:cysteinyl-tRNA synthetase